MALSVGDRAPEFELQDQQGRTVRLSDVLARSNAAVVYFYPKDDTTGCTIEAKTFRDAYAEFRDAGAEIVGISSDDVASHCGFAEKYNLGFILLSDVDGRVRRAYDVTSTFGLLPGRVTYVIDGAGIVRHVFSSQVRVKTHVHEALSTVRALTKGARPTTTNAGTDRRTDVDPATR